jgi:hypothetical protein
LQAPAIATIISANETAITKLIKRANFFILIPMPVRQPAQIVMKTEPQDFRFLIQWA